MNNHLLTDETVNIRDSWDILETPSTSHSEIDDSPVQQTPDTEEYCQRDSNDEITSQKMRPQKQLRETNLKLGKQRCSRGDVKLRAKRQNKPIQPSTVGYNTRASYSPRTPFQAGLLLRELTNKQRPVSAQSFNDTPKVLPKRYRKLGLRSHDDMLKEQLDELRTILNDSERMSKTELSQHHVLQTANMIGESVKCGFIVLCISELSGDYSIDYERHAKSYFQLQHDK